jgi:hypothetical protein
MERSGIERSGMERNGINLPFHCLDILRWNGTSFLFHCLDNERNGMNNTILFLFYLYFKYTNITFSKLVIKLVNILK